VSDRDLVGAGIQQPANVLDLAYATADRERDEDLLGDRLDHVQDDVALVGARGDVEEREFVRALLVVAARDLDRVTGVAQADEVDALDDATAVTSRHGMMRLASMGRSGDRPAG